MQVLSSDDEPSLQLQFQHGFYLFARFFFFLTNLNWTWLPSRTHQTAPNTKHASPLESQSIHGTWLCMCMSYFNVELYAIKYKIKITNRATRFLQATSVRTVCEFEHLVGLETYFRMFPNIKDGNFLVWELNSEWTRGASATKTSRKITSYINFADFLAATVGSSGRHWCKHVSCDPKCSYTVGAKMRMENTVRKIMLFVFKQKVIQP